ncbi:hypothetical protein CHISP_0895 [Chitinispirillum alkaliphilum]|nr:hypothetical protein CHISP_0895 [Chitinispirillum alkaliphilum]
MKKIFSNIIRSVCTLLIGTACLGCALGGRSADVSLTYVSYPETSFIGITNIAVMPFDDGSLQRERDFWSFWSILETHYQRNSLPILLAENLSTNLIQSGEFNVFDRSMVSENSNLDMVISGLITSRDVSYDVERRTSTDSQGNRRTTYRGSLKGLLSVNYRFINPETGQIIHSLSLETNHTQNSRGNTYSEARNRLADENTVLRDLVQRSNWKFMGMFVPREITANYALAVIREDEIFSKSLLAARNNRWDEASGIWNTYQNQNYSEAYYNNMLYLRYIRNDLEATLQHLKSALEITKEPSFALWKRKFERELERKNAYYSEK